MNDLKKFVENILSLTGKRPSPGGGVKLFKSDDDSRFIIKWNGPRSKRISIQGDDQDQYLKLKFEELAN